MGWLRDSVKGLHEISREDIRKTSAKAILEKIKKPDRHIMPARAEDIKIGKFYFLFYDLSGTTNRMEQFSPVLLVDIKKVKTKTIMYGLCFNFIPSNIRILYFDQLLNKFQNTISKNLEASNIDKEEALNGLSFDIIYKSLMSSGFEYAIREFDVSKITKCYKVATSYLPNFLVFDTQPFTGVDESKLIDIWRVKLKQQEERHKEILAKLQTDYNSMAKMFEQEFQSISERNANLEKSINHLKNVSGE